MQYTSTAGRNAVRDVSDALLHQTAVRPYARRRQFKRQKLKEDPSCVLCGERLTRKTATVDHIVAKARGGQEHESNYQLMCFQCNVMKGADPIDRW